MQITSDNRTDVPLRVTLHCDPNRRILDFSSLNLSLSNPSPSTILAFHGISATVRFDQATFREHELDEQDGPSDAVFEEIKKLAEDLEEERDCQVFEVPAIESDSSGIDDLVKPKQYSKGNIRSRGKAKLRATKSSSPETVPSSPSTAGCRPESDDDLFGHIDPSTKYDFPVVVLAFTQRTYWPVTLTGYNRAQRKFVCEFDTGEVREVAEKCLVTKANPKFFSVDVGEVAYKLRPELLTKFVRAKQDVLRAILVDGFEPARRWSADFFAGGGRRAELNTRLKVGDLKEEHIDTLGEAIREHVLPRVSHSCYRMVPDQLEHSLTARSLSLARRRARTPPAPPAARRTKPCPTLSATNTSQPSSFHT